MCALSAYIPIKHAINDANLLHATVLPDYTTGLIPDNMFHATCNKKLPTIRDATLLHTTVVCNKVALCMACFSRDGPSNMIA